MDSMPALQATPENETQRQLRNDPRFERLMEQIDFPKDDRLHYGVQCNEIKNPKSQVASYEVMLNVKGTW